MSGFLAQLRRYLTEVDRGIDLREPDVARHRAHFLRRLQEIETTDPVRADAEYRDWPAHRLSRFLRKVVLGLRNGIAFGLPAPDVVPLLDEVIDAYLGLPVGGGAIRTAELRRVARVAEYETGDADAWTDTEHYAIETRLVSASPTKRALTRSGRVLTAIPDDDAARLLLSLEIVQSSGVADSHRLSSAGAEMLIRAPNATLDAHPDSDAIWPAPYPVLQRLASLGLIRIRDSDDLPETSYAVTPHGESLLSELTASEDGAWTVAARALVDEERGRALSTWIPELEKLSTRASAELSAREARLVAHEVRNALSPVRVHLDRLYRAVARSAPELALDPLREPVDSGIARVFEFIDARLAIAAILESAGEVFDLDGALTEVARSSPGVDTSLGAAGTRVRGARHSFVLVIGELVRNARSADASREVRVAVSSSRRNGTVHIHVDDDGPGVSPELREQIFERGFSTRGTSGHGLALAREVVESAMNGSIRCEGSPLGGARVTIVLSVHEQSRGTP